MLRVVGQHCCVYVTCNIQQCWELLANIVASVCMGLNVWCPKQAGACKCSKNSSYIAWCTFLQNRVSRKIFLDLLINTLFAFCLFVSILRPINFLRSFSYSNRFTIAATFGATASTCLRIFTEGKTGLFPLGGPAWVKGGKQSNPLTL